MKNIDGGTKKLSAEQKETLIETLRTRFEENMNRHKGMTWSKVLARLETRPGALWSLNEMERTGGEPDVIAQDKKTGAYIFCDCSTESPSGRRSLCYDREALIARKEHKPKSSAMDIANAMGVELLSEEDYLDLQKVGPFDTKTSSWIRTPDDIRDLGGAIYGDHRYGRTFIGHNGADSYYAARGFRGALKV